jgi:hypothetical protein
MNGQGRSSGFFLAEQLVLAAGSFLKIALLWFFCPNSRPAQITILVLRLQMLKVRLFSGSLNQWDGRANLQVP